jgi:hypothetical protein
VRTQPAIDRTPTVAVEAEDAVASRKIVLYEPIVKVGSRSAAYLGAVLSPSSFFVVYREKAEVVLTTAFAGLSIVLKYTSFYSEAPAAVISS